ncbi:hypothetical protein [Telluribacter humicola]|uniref:hypothetical protein n=1 Tax=Telluribacter humicola TaxID=1720261 RepID=UPI001E63DE8C|nr:hypothetical protein [Telluribacter humicola]
MPIKLLICTALTGLLLQSCHISTTTCSGARKAPEFIKVVDQERMQEVYEEIKTPYKYGVVFRHPDTTKAIDSPTIFRMKDRWWMTYIVYDGQGYETWLA